MRMSHRFQVAVGLACSRRIVSALLSISLVILCALGASDNALATDGTWIHTSNAAWDVNGNWSGGNIANGIDGIADFSTLNIGADITVHLNSLRTIGNLIFGDTSPSNNWILDNNGIPASILTLSVSSGSPTITVNNQTATISAVLAGAQGLTKFGAGTLTLSAANTYTGGTVVNGGILSVAYANNDGKSTVGGSNLTINNAATVRVDQNNALGFDGNEPATTINAGGLLMASSTVSQHLGSLTLSGGTLASAAPSGAASTFGTFNLDNNLTAGGSTTTSVISALFFALTTPGGTTFTVNPGTANGIDLDVTGTIGTTAVANTGLIKAGAGVMRLSNTNTFTAGVTINAGTLAVGVNGAALPANGVVTVQAGATLDLQLYTNFAANALSNLTLNGGTLRATGATNSDYYTKAFTMTGGTVDFTNTPYTWIHLTTRRRHHDQRVSHDRDLDRRRHVPLPERHRQRDTDHRRRGSTLKRHRPGCRHDSRHQRGDQPGLHQDRPRHHAPDQHRQHGQHHGPRRAPLLERPLHQRRHRRVRDARHGHVHSRQRRPCLRRANGHLRKAYDSHVRFGGIITIVAPAST